MQRLLLLSVLLLGASWAVAQDPATAPGQNDSTQSTPTQSGSTHAGAGAQTVEGCLSGTNGKYTLTDKQGQSYDLTGDTSKLADHVGHEVKITGTAGSGSPSSGSQMGNTSSGGMTLEVSSVKHVAKTCKNAGGGGMSH
jgi:hypothetical protein